MPLERIRELELVTILQRVTQADQGACENPDCVSGRMLLYFSFSCHFAFWLIVPPCSLGASELAMAASSSNQDDRPQRV